MKSQDLRDMCTAGHLRNIKVLHQENTKLYRDSFSTDEEAQNASRNEIGIILHSSTILFLRNQKYPLTLEITRLYLGIQSWIDSNFEDYSITHSVEKHEHAAFLLKDPTLTDTKIKQRLVGFCSIFFRHEAIDALQVISEHLRIYTDTEVWLNGNAGKRIIEEISEVVEREYCEEEEYLLDQITVSEDTGKSQESSSSQGKGEETSEDKEGESNLKSQAQELLNMMSGLIGLDSVKEDVKTIANLARVQSLRRSQGLPNPAYSYHMVFTGNPGTGKTTVARLLGKIFHSVGCISKGHFLECDRSSLVGAYLGETAIKTKKILSRALGGILFIDEAYSLVQDSSGSEDSYGREAVDTILKFMEDNRDDLIIIVAGYKEKMNNFIDSNPGLRSRFNKYFHFQDYNANELLEIFLAIAAECHYEISLDAISRANKVFEEAMFLKAENFGNGRTVRNFFERCLANQANRISVLVNPSRDDLMMIKEEDVRVEDMKMLL